MVAATPQNNSVYAATGASGLGLLQGPTRRGADTVDR